MKSKIYAKEQAIANPHVIVYSPEAPPGPWEERFGRTAPLHVEIGMGSGRHLAQTALRMPGHNHIGIESKYYRVYKGTRWIREFDVPENVRFLVGDVFEMDGVFAPGQVDGITMLFPDPWARSRGERFRLTNPQRLEAYRRWLKPGGKLHFRTDHEWLYHYSVERFRRGPWQLELAVPIQRVISDFEYRYLGQGLPIYGLTATRSD